MLLAWNELTNNELVQSIVATMFKAIIGLLVVWLLFKIINLLCRKIENKLNKNDKIDATVASFIRPLISKVLKFFVLVCYVGYIGIETSSIAAAITSAGLAIGLAMQGSLSNFAGGFIILVMRPFKVGDYIQTCQEEGTVESIQVFYTTLVTPDNRVIKIPNGQVANSLIIDSTVKSTRRLDLMFPIAYKNDFNKAKQVIRECIIKTGLTLTQKSEPFINFSFNSDGYVEILVRVWVRTDDYWTLHFKLLEDVKIAFDKNNIDIPYSRYEVNVINK